jgi:hypothetical protein
MGIHRPDTNSIMLHPYFWDAGRRLHFLQDASDRFEIMCRDPRDAMLEQLETGAIAVVGHDWHQRLDRVFLDNLGKFRKYDGRSVQDLMRALRNKVRCLFCVWRNAGLTDARRNTTIRTFPRTSSDTLGLCRTGSLRTSHVGSRGSSCTYMASSRTRS